MFLLQHIVGYCIMVGLKVMLLVNNGCVLNLVSNILFLHYFVIMCIIRDTFDSFWLLRLKVFSFFFCFPFHWMLVRFSYYVLHYHCSEHAFNLKSHHSSSSDLLVSISFFCTPLSSHTLIYLWMDNDFTSLCT